MMKEDMKSILVIDDDPGLLAFLQKRLGEAGYRVVVEVSGTIGFEKMKADPPDLVIADVMMPGMDGFSFVREIRSDEALGKIPVIIVTAQEDLADLFKMEGVRGFLPKPVDTQMLMDKVCELIG
jgi:CheY-like chemotaxis protein